MFFIGFFTGIVFMGLLSVGIFYALKTMFGFKVNNEDEDNMEARRDKVKLGK